MTSPLRLVSFASLATVIACAAHAPPAPPAAAASPAAASPPLETPPPAGTVVGTFRENHYGVWKAWQPLLIGDAVRFTPAAGWATQEEATTALADLAARSPGRPSSVAILAVGDRFVARFLVAGRGGDLRPWHIPLETRAANARWVATVDGPSMFVRVSAQSRSLDWCSSYMQGSWGAVPATSPAFQPTDDPVLLDVLYRRRSRFSGRDLREWAAGAPDSRAGTATYVTRGSSCRVSIDLGGASEVREYIPGTDDSMALVIAGSSSPLHLVRLTGADAAPPE